MGNIFWLILEIAILLAYAGGFIAGLGMIVLGLILYHRSPSISSERKKYKRLILIGVSLILLQAVYDAGVILLNMQKTNQGYQSTYDDIVASKVQLYMPATLKIGPIVGSLGSSHTWYTTTPIKDGDKTITSVSYSLPAEKGMYEEFTVASSVLTLCPQSSYNDNGSYYLIEKPCTLVQTMPNGARVYKLNPPQSANPNPSYDYGYYIQDGSTFISEGGSPFQIPNDSIFPSVYDYASSLVPIDTKKLDPSAK